MALDNIDFSWAVEDFLIPRGWAWREGRGWYHKDSPNNDDNSLGDALTRELADQWLENGNLIEFTEHMQAIFEKKTRDP